MAETYRNDTLGTPQLDAEFAELMDQIASKPSMSGGYMQSRHDDYAPLDAEHANLASQHGFPSGYIPRATELGIPLSYNPHNLATEMVITDAVTKQTTILRIGDGPDCLSKEDTEQTYAAVRQMAAAKGIHDHVRLAPLAVKALQLRLQAKQAALQRRIQQTAPQYPTTPWQAPRPVAVAPPPSLVGMSLGSVAPADVAQAAAQAAFTTAQYSEQPPATPAPPAAPPAPAPRRLTVVLAGVGQFETYWTDIIDDPQDNTLTLVFDANRDLVYWEPPANYRQPFAVQEAGSPVKMLVELTGVRTRVGSNLIHILRVRNRG